MKISFLATLSIAFLALLSSCNVGPTYQKPVTPVADHFADGKQEGYSSDAAISEWWHRLDDAELNQLVTRALANNRDLQIAAARIEESLALYRAARYDLFPTVRSDASFTRTHTSKVETLPLPGVSSNSQIADVGLQATWELDLWGRVRQSVRAAKADLQSFEEQRHDTMVALTSDLARTYLELRGLQNQLAVAQQNAQNQSETLKLTQNLLQGGRGTELDTSRALAQYKTTQAVIPPLQSAISKDVHAISVLVGEQPQALEAELLPSKSMPALPGLVRIGKPEELLRRRPDIRAAERSLEASTLRVGVATADLFPKVVFNGTVDTQASTIGRLFGPGTAASSFGPNITWAAFDLGRVKAQIDAAGARAKEQLLTYEKTVLVALQETEDSLTDFGRQRARRDYLSDAADASEKAAKLARERFQQGAADFLTVLDAERTMLDAQSQLAESQTTMATSLVAIYKALGGGWEGGGKLAMRSMK